MKPWEHPEMPWKTQPAFYSWMRSGLRRVWTRHPAKNLLAKKLRKRKPLGKKGQNIWALQCTMCHKWLPQNKIQMDHIHPAGTFKNEEDIQAFVTNLLIVTPEDLQPLCKPCHALVSLSERKNISIEQAAIIKKAIAFSKCTVKDQVALLHLWKMMTPEITNAKQRRATAEQFYTNEHEYEKANDLL